MEYNHSQMVLDLARKHGLLRPKDLSLLKIPRVYLTRLVQEGQLQRIARGLYSIANHSYSEHGALAEVARKSGNGVFCLLTALRFHDLTTQAPFEVWLAIPNKSHPPKIDYPPLRVVRFSKRALTEEVEEHIVDGVTIRVYGIAKTIADCFKYRNKIGLDVALESLREAWRAKRVSMDDLWRNAHICRVANVMRPYLETLE